MAIVSGGLVVAPDGVREADVLVEGGRIAAVVAPGEAGGGLIDARGCVVLAGGVDPHTHLLSDIVPAAVSAAYGGTTTALSFTAPRPGETPQAAFVRARDGQVPLAAIDVGLHPSIWEPDRLTAGHLEELRDLGARSVKLFLAYPELGMMASDRTLYETLRAASRLGLLVQVHCENGGAIAAWVAELLAARRKDARAFVEARPAELEEEAVARTLALAAVAGAPVYLVHLSCAGSLEQVRAARRRGQTVFAEACTHHLVLDDRVYGGPDAERFVIVPPLRDREHVEALWDAVADGTLDAIGSDHAQVPYRPDVAPGDFTSIPYGCAGIEVRLPLVLSEGRRRDVPLERLAELLCAGPARIFGYPKGAIVAGADADLVLWDPAGSWTIEPEALHDGRPDTPYSGLAVSGRIRLVLQRGEVVTEPGTKAPVPLAGPT